MILNPNLYKAALDMRKETLIRGVSEGPRYDTLTVFSLGAHIPIVAVIAYVLRPDVCGPNPELQKVLEINLECYKYESVIPWSDIS